MKKIQRGFTLIEVMIVLAIVGILAAIAVPMYLDYAIRSQVAEGVSLAAGAKVALAESWQDGGVFPADNDAAGLADAPLITGKYVVQVEVVAGGFIEVTYGNEVNDKILNAVLTIRAFGNNGNVSWECTGDATLVEKWLPPSCRA